MVLHRPSEPAGLTGEVRSSTNLDDYGVYQELGLDLARIESVTELRGT